MRTNIEYLRELLTTDEQHEFLDAIKGEFEDLKYDVKQLQKENNDLQTENDEKAGIIDNHEDHELTEIVTPLGSVSYEVHGSLTLHQFMESIEPKIRAL